VRVLELGSTVAGPFCGRLFADFGAEVIKVEAADGDPVRAMGKQWRGRSLYAASIFRNKALVSVDLRRPAGQEVARRLVRRCDVVIENFRPGTLERWKLGYADLAVVNPGVILVRISGFGQDGPYAQRPGFGVIGEAMSGLRHVTGDPDRPPARIAVSLTDCLTGLYAAFGAAMALLVQRQTGRGQCIDAALYECAFSFMEPHVPAFDKLGHVASRAGSRLPDNTPNNLYPTRDGGYLHVTAVGETLFRRLAEALGHPEWGEDERFRTAAARARYEDELDAAIAAWTGARDLAEAEARLLAAEVPATRIFTMADIFRDPHYRARGALVDAPAGPDGTIRLANVVPRLSATPGAVRHAGGAVVGADTARVLREIGGYTEEEIAALQRDGAVLCAP
jgi:crotonobetainyl-CoA:carnitine CoA-transferase CaiB-like acyl-CoA transferase